MPAYIIFTREHTTDAEQMAQYAEKAPLANQGHDLTALAFYGQYEVLEGSDIEGAVLVRFPDMAAARQWYNSPAYQNAMKHRQKGANYRVLLIDGLPESIQTSSL